MGRALCRMSSMYIVRRRMRRLCPTLRTSAQCKEGWARAWMARREERELQRRDTSTRTGRSATSRRACTARIRRRTHLSERSLFPRHGDDQIQRADRRKREPIARHVRRAERGEHPPEIQRMPHPSIRARDLQRVTTRPTPDARQLQSGSIAPDRSRDDPRRRRAEPPGARRRATRRRDRSRRRPAARRAQTPMSSRLAVQT